jgi:hypothetical protein
MFVAEVLTEGLIEMLTEVLKEVLTGFLSDLELQSAS